MATTLVIVLLAGSVFLAVYQRPLWLCWIWALLQPGGVLLPVVLFSPRLRREFAEQLRTSGVENVRKDSSDSPEVPKEPDAV